MYHVSWPTCPTDSNCRALAVVSKVDISFRTALRRKDKSVAGHCLCCAALANDVDFSDEAGIPSDYVCKICNKPGLCVCACVSF